MKEIKFKVLNKLANRISPLSHLDVMTIINHIKFKQGYMYLEETEWAKFLQYTGLKDKNGVEIYEGDIIIKPANKNRHLEVVFSDDISCFEAIHSTGARSLNGYVKSDGGVLIIGNRWDSPELLEPHT